MFDAGPQLVEVYLVAGVGSKQTIVLKADRPHPYALDFQNSSTIFVFDNSVGVAHDSVLFVEDRHLDLVKNSRIGKP